MSLSSFLLVAGDKKGKGRSIDEGLDDIFRSAVSNILFNADFCSLSAMNETAAPISSAQLPSPSPVHASSPKRGPETSVPKADRKRKLQNQETSLVKAKKSRKEIGAALGQFALCICVAS